MLAACLGAGWTVGSTALGVRINHYVYDVLTLVFGSDSSTAASDEVAVVAIDERTLKQRGGMRGMCGTIPGRARWTSLRDAPGRVVVSDVVLADPQDAAEDARLAASLLATKNLILPCQIVGGKWEDPLPIFRDSAVALGHVYQLDPGRVNADGVNRDIPLEEIRDGKQRWALSLEAFAAYQGQRIVESTADENLQIGPTVIPEPRREWHVPMFIRYLRSERIPVISALDILDQKDKLRDRAVFLGITALSAARDRLTNPFGDTMPGVQVHAEAFETMLRGKFLTPASDTTVIALCLATTVAAGLIFVFVPGWWAYAVDFCCW